MNAEHMMMTASRSIPWVSKRHSQCKRNQCLHDRHPSRLLIFRPVITFPNSSGTELHIIARPMLYNLIYDKIPKEKIHLNKRVVSILNGDIGARVNCTDGSTFDGDIIVGADGAYSPVRQGLFKWLKQNNKLPSSDDVLMPYNCVCLVGQTGELDAEEFPDIGKSSCSFESMTSTATPYTVTLVCLR